MADPLIGWPPNGPRMACQNLNAASTLV